MSNVEVLLIEDVPTLGLAGEIVNVKGGYARNYLVPQALATLATSGARKQAEQIRLAGEKRRARALENAQDFAAQVNRLLLRFERKVGDRGRLYGSVTSTDIAERIEQAIELEEELDKRKILLEEPIKTLGNFEVPLHIHPDVSVSVKVEVVGDQGEMAADFAEMSDAGLSPVAPDEPQPDADY